MTELDLVLEKPADTWSVADLELIARCCNLDQPRLTLKEWRQRARQSPATAYRAAQSGRLKLTRDGSRAYVMRLDGARYFGLLMQQNRAAAQAA